MSATTTTRHAVGLSIDINNTSSTGEKSLKRTPSLRTRSAPALPRSSGRSPRDSASSSDEELQTSHTTSRGRSLGSELEHKLHEAVSSIQVTRSMSPESRKSSTDSNVSCSAPVVEVTSPSARPSPSLDAPSRSAHVKSSSHHNLGFIQLPSNRQRDVSCAIEVEADYDTNDSRRPHRMVRKKSGELVRSSLKSGSRTRRPASMPSTPAYTKNVHFDRKLEHVRHFLHSEKPAAVSATTSPVQEYQADTEFPFRTSPRKADDDYELSIELPNFVPETQQTANENAIIKVETVYLSTDKRCLIGRVAVRNLAFQKFVGVRYTLDYWKTTSETAAEYTVDIRKKQRDDGFDRFLFEIKIDDFTGVTDKTMFFCVRYCTGGQEYWDSNSGHNFQVEFHKRPSLARRSSDPPIMAPIRRASQDEIDIKTPAPLKSSRSLIFENIYTDHPDNVIDDDRDAEKAVRVKAGRRAAATDSFSNRYDFGASLTAAIAAANSLLQGSGDEIKYQKKPQIEHVEHASRGINPYFTMNIQAGYNTDHRVPATISPTFPLPLDSSQGNTPASSGDVSPIPGILAKSEYSKNEAYQTLLDNYCFFQPKSVKSTGAKVPEQKVTIRASKPQPHSPSPYDTPPYSASPPTGGSPLFCSRSAMDNSPIYAHSEISSTGSSTPIQI